MTDQERQTKVEFCRSLDVVDSIQAQEFNSVTHVYKMFELNINSPRNAVRKVREARTLEPKGVNKRELKCKLHIYIFHISFFMF